ncbi:hypothetical protein BJ170DRAFT_633363 [Xylariales sp. AK1849]|nr:hypothetical protein BJ170DRAFT_633363 [Xylariales sp. AK1849]
MRLSKRLVRKVKRDDVLHGDWAQPLFCTIVVLLVAIFCLFFRPISTKQVEAIEKPNIHVKQVYGKPKRNMTLRITEIPVDKSRKAVERDLKSIAISDPGLRETLDTLELRSLVQENKRVACATVTISTLIPEDELLQRFHQAGSKLPYRLDCNFDGVTPLHEDDSGAKVDVIAVPGLASHAIGSWKSPRSNDVWLRDYLPDDVSNVRVLLYGYDTKLSKSDSRKSIEDMGKILLESITAFRANSGANRPVIFIGHSLGGLLIKEALIHAQKKKNYKNEIFKACCGLLFFGVPNLGLRNEQLLGIVKGQPDEALIRDLKVDQDSEPSSFLERISSQFAECCKGRFRVISFYELKHSPTVERQPNGTLLKTGERILMVTKKSATSTGLTAIADEDNIPLDVDHSGLVKYDSRSQEEYAVVRERLSTLVSEGLAVGAKRLADDRTSKLNKRYSFNDADEISTNRWSNSLSGQGNQNIGSGSISIGRSQHFNRG